MNMRADDHFYRALLDGLYDGVYVVDRAAVITYWNKGAEKITGHKASEVLGNRCRESILNHTDAQGNSLCDLPCPLVVTLEDGIPREAELYLRHRDGHRVPVHVRVTPLHDAAGVVAGPRRGLQRQLIRGGCASEGGRDA